MDFIPPPPTMGKPLAWQGVKEGEKGKKTQLQIYGDSKEQDTPVPRTVLG